MSHVGEAHNSLKKTPHLSDDRIWIYVHPANQITNKKVHVNSTIPVSSGKIGGKVIVEIGQLVVNYQKPLRNSKSEHCEALSAV